MTKIIPHLWFDNQAEEAVEFYCEVFDNSKILNTTKYHVDTPSNKPIGSVMSVDFEIEGQPFIALNGGPIFKFNPSISFMFHCESKERVDSLWSHLIEDGRALMALDNYPFNERYGWLEDKYGLSWQLLYTDPSDIDQIIVPKIMYVGESCGRAEEAINHYVSIFDNSEIQTISRYGDTPGPDNPDHLQHASFILEDQKFAAMDSAHDHKFTFNEAISFMRLCENQEEIDHFWEKISADPSGGQCGWQKDKFGVSWQIVPENMDKMLKNEDTEKVEKVMKAFLEMKKIDINTLQEIFNS